ncbi:MAG: proline--tRNA ligase [Synergistaceae bacterium]|jgi:prolyl-tRNA synthetase|nr:proline--tRNA ligase [Synergistaceae bacterium]
MARNITPKEKNYSDWYLDVIRAAELADYAPVRGCMVIRPNGYGIWENIQAVFDRGFKETGHVNAYFPLLIPNSFMEREAQHVEGFAPECAVVTHAGGEELEEPFVIRPTSETVIGHMYSQWVQSWRDLPILINQWCNVMRWEKRPRLFLRTSEFLWQEGHTAHATREEAFEETFKMLDVYQSIMQHELALPVLYGEKSENERFPGADNTYSCEAMMSDKRALQAGTSHFLGQNFARAFDISFQDQNEERAYAWTTSWGVSTRLIGAIIMTHSDNDGLVLPPRIAPVKAIIIPISSDESLLRDKLEPVAEKVSGEIDAALGGMYSKIDRQYHIRPADRFFRHLQRGIPVRVEIGAKEFADGAVTIVRRDTAERERVPMGECAARVKGLLATIQQNLYDRAKAFREANTHDVDNMDDLKKFFSPEGKGGFARVYFAGSSDDEGEIKYVTGGATIRCMPVDDESRGKCIYTGKPEGRRAILAKAY